LPGVSAADVARAYSALAERYVELFGTVGSVDPDDLRLVDAHLARRTGPVLDLGCGPGHLSGFLARTCPVVTGIDLVPEFLDHARRSSPEARFVRASLTALPVADAAVAGVLAWFSLIHLDPAELDGVLGGIRRVLRPGGALVVGFFVGPLVEPFEHRVVRAHRWPVGEFAGRLAAAGFTVVERAERPARDGHRPYAVLAARAPQA